MQSVPMNKPSNSIIQKTKFLNDIFSKPQLAHCQRLVQGLITAAKKNLSEINSSFLNAPDVSNLIRFLRDAPWDYQEVNIKRIKHLQNNPLTKAKKSGYVILDNIIWQKVGKKIKAAGWHYDTKSKTTVWGINLVSLFYADNKKKYPLNYAIYHKDRKSSKIDLAKGLLKEIFTKLKLPAEVILCDNWYSYAKNFLKYCIHKLNKTVIAEFKTKLCIIYNNELISLKELSKKLKPENYQLIKNGPCGKQYVAEVIAELPEVGKFKFLFIKKQRKSTKIAKIIGSSNIKYSALEIMNHYAYRWQIEVSYWQEKNYFGLGKYQGTSIEGLLKYIAIEFLTHTITGVEQIVHDTYTLGQIIEKYYLNCLESFIDNIVKIYKKYGDTLAVKQQLLKKFYIR